MSELTLDEAWTAAEAAVGSRAGFLMLSSSVPGQYMAHWRDVTKDEYDAEDEYVTGNPTEAYGHGSTPTAALLALARALASTSGTREP